MCTLKGAFSFHLHFEFSHPTSFDISSALKKIVAFLQSAQINSVETTFDLGQMTLHHYSYVECTKESIASIQNFDPSDRRYQNGSNSF